MASTSTIKQTPTTTHHSAYMNLQPAKLVTNIPPPVLMWHSTDLVSGERVVVATALCTTQQQHHSELALVGIVPRALFVFADPQCAQAIVL